MQAARAYDDVEAPLAAPPIDVTPLLGRWSKTNEGPQWIRRLEIARSGDGVAVHVWGDRPPAPADWGTVTAEAIFANGILSSTGSAFIARFDCGDFTTELQGNANLGLLVVACFHRFDDERADLFTREFFYLEADA